MTTSTKSEDVETLAPLIMKTLNWCDEMAGDGFEVPELVMFDMWKALGEPEGESCGPVIADTLRALCKERDALLKENASLRETLTAEWAHACDEFTDQIEAAHPFREPKDFRRYNLAQAMVSSRRSKLELIKLVAWLLTFKAEQERARAALGIHQ